MDNPRLFLWLGLFAFMWFTYRAWVTDYQPIVPEEQVTNSEQQLPEILVEGAGLTPDLSVVLSSESTLQQSLSAPVRIRTDVFDVTIDKQGGDLVRVGLPHYPVDKDVPDVPMRLLDFVDAERWVFQSGLRTVEEDIEPNHLATFQSARPEYVLGLDEEELQVSLNWEEEGPLTAEKVYTFRRGQYSIELKMLLENRSDVIWRGAAYAQMVRRNVPLDRSFTDVNSYSFRGPVLSDGNGYEKLDVDDLAETPLVQSNMGGWLAGIQHHFVAAVVPPPDEQINYQAAVRGSDYVITALSGVKEVPPGSELEFVFQLFVGPKLQNQLAATGNKLEQTVDYGKLTLLSQPLFWLLSKAHSYVGNWGLAIILVTLLIKLAFYKLTAASGRSMAKLRQLQPRMKALQEQYKDNREELTRKTMEMYKREKVNPAAGCLPILIQMPFFFAFYWVLIESVEMRQAPFMLWIDDLSARDPFFILPVLNGAAMFFQQKLNPSPATDPMQAKVLQFMPVAFSVMFAFFPAGLVLYWLTNAVLSIAQQWRINKLVAGQ